MANSPATISVFDTDAPDTLPDNAENFLAYPWTLAPIKARFPNAKKICCGLELGTWPSR